MANKVRVPSADPQREIAKLEREVGQLGRDLAAALSREAEALEQQTATSEILRVISQSPSDIQPVMDSIVEHAARLADADHAFIGRAEGDEVRWLAAYGTPLAGEGAPISRALPSGRAMLDRQTTQVADIAALADEFPTVGWAYRELGVRTILATPLLREGAAIGVLLMRRLAVRPFTDQQIELLKTFADQAVIAIENTRLFRELQDRNRDLFEALERQTATSEILRVIAGSPADLQPVLDAVARNAAGVCGADDAHIRLLDGEALRLVATHGALPGQGVGETLPLGRGTVVGRAVIERKTLHIGDLSEEPGEEFPETRLFVEQRLGVRLRTMLATPLLREGEPIGAVVIRRLEVRPFTEQQIALLETFADQAVIAIENARLFEELQDKTRQLEEVSRHKSEFLANMSHELRTPLNAIIGFSEVLVEQMFGDLNDRQLEYQQDILTSGQHLLSLINDILDLSKVEAGRMELEVATFSLREAMENGLTMLKERAGRHGIVLGLEIDPDLDLIEADERKVKQVVFNLLSNAVKFTPDGGRVELMARRVDGEVQIAVVDTGIGISPEDRVHIFEEFRQVGQGTAKAEGTGLGLALTKKLIELHGGRIWVESEVGVGSTFTFRLPARL